MLPETYIFLASHTTIRGNGSDSRILFLNLNPWFFVYALFHSLSFEKRVEKKGVTGPRYPAELLFWMFLANIKEPEKVENYSLKMYLVINYNAYFWVFCDLIYLNDWLNEKFDKILKKISLKSDSNKDVCDLFTKLN